MGTDTLLEFPCSFTVKAMGLANTGFEQEVITLLQTKVPELTEQNMKVKPSKTGKYSSVSLTFMAQSKAQLDSIYHLLTDCESVIMAL